MSTTVIKIFLNKKYFKYELKISKSDNQEKHINTFLVHDKSKLLKAFFNYSKLLYFKN